MNWLHYWQGRFDTENLLDALVGVGFVAINSALPIELYQALVKDSFDENQYKAAKITQGGRLETIRSDSTRWIDEVEETAGKSYLAALQGLGDYLNQSLYLGVRSVEAHYACYDIGQFYAQHRDNPQGSNLRAISTVLYLNSNFAHDPFRGGQAMQWQAEWGGALRLVDIQDTVHDILPIANRLVVFQSDLPHEVLPASQIRRSIAGWLRRDACV